MTLYVWPPVQASVNTAGLASEATLSSIKTNTDTLVTDVGIIKAAVPGSLLKGIVFDYIGVDESGATTNVYTYFAGGSGGTLKRTITVTFTDANKAVMQSIAATDPA
jgi:hypothetical protein